MIGLVLYTLTALMYLFLTLAGYKPPCVRQSPEATTTRRDQGSTEPLKRSPAVRDHAPRFPANPGAAALHITRPESRRASLDDRS